MNLIIEIQICDKTPEPGYWPVCPAELNHLNAQFLSLDNFSDKVTIDAVSQTIDDSQWTIVIVQGEPQGAIGQIQKVIKSVVRHSNSFLLYQSELTKIETISRQMNKRDARSSFSKTPPYQSSIENLSLPSK